MKKFFSTYFFPISISLLLVVMALGFWLGIKPLSERVALQRDEIQKFHTARENRSRQLGALSDLRKQFEGIISDEHILNILLTDDRIISFIKIVEEEAQAAGVEIAITAQGHAAAIVERPATAAPAKAGSAPTLIDEVPFTRYLPLNINAVGPYENTVLFLHKLETLPIALDVIAMTVEPLAEDEESPVARAGNNPNPFLAVLGDASFDTASLPVLSAKDSLQAKFEVLIYTDPQAP